MSEMEVPEGWELKRLGDICTVENGYAFKSNDFQQKGIPLIRISEIQNGGVTFSGNTVYLDKSFLGKKQNFVVKTGDILVALSGATSGKCGIYEKKEPSLLNQRVGRLKFNNPNSNLQKYLFYFMNKITNDILSKSYGGAQPNISTREIENFKILIPNKNLLPKIVKKLDYILGIIEEKKNKILKLNNLENLTSFFESTKFFTLQSIRTGILDSENWKNYPKVKLGTITKITSGGTPNRQIQEYWNGSIPWLKSGELLDGDIKNSEENITEKGLSNSSAKLFPKNTILVALYGQGKTRGKTGRLLIESSTNQAICAILPNPIFQSKYIQYWIRSLYWELRKSASGGAQPNWNASTIKEIEIILPPLDEQKKLIVKLDEKLLELNNLEKMIDKIKEQKNKNINHINHILLSVLNSAFSGKLI